MRGLVIVIALVASLIVASSADAFVWHLTYNQAKHGTKEVAIEDCRQDRECIGYGVGQCRRITESRIDCVEGLFHRDELGEMECNTVLHWGIRAGGYIKYTYGKPHCFYL